MNYFFSKIPYILNTLQLRIFQFLNKKKTTHEKIPDGKFISIIFQVHDDTQILDNSPLIKKMDDILDFFYEDIVFLFPEHKIIIKEHPVDI